MRLAFLGDVHLGNHKRHAGVSERSLNERCRDTLAVLDRAVRVASKESDLLVVLGDLFDDARPIPQLVEATMRALEGPQILLVVGNHDQQSDQEGDHALGPLAHLSNVRVVSQPEVVALRDCSLACVPHAASPAFPARLAAFLAGVQRPTFLAFHAGVSDSRTPFFLKDAPDSIAAGALLKLMDEHGVKSAFCGNWHSHKTWADDRIVQVGALVPTGFDNPGLAEYGRMAILDTQTGKVSFERFEGPRFVTVHGLADLRKVAGAAASDRNRKLYVKATVDAGEYEASRAVVRGADSFHACELALEDASRKEAAQSAAQAARSASTLSGALEKYVGEMPLDAGIDRTKVLAKCSEYLGGNAK